MGGAGSISDHSSRYRLGIDVGGTFTDVCVFTPEGNTIRTNVPSTGHDQRIGVKNGIKEARKQLNTLYNWYGKFDGIHHGTTVGTKDPPTSFYEITWKASDLRDSNKRRPQGKGAKTGLILTTGHKDVLDVRRSQIPGGLGSWINFVSSDPIVALEGTVQCTGMIGYDGETVTSIDEDSLRKDLARLREQKPEAITISLINAYKNNAHEK